MLFYLAKEIAPSPSDPLLTVLAAGGLLSVALVFWFRFLLPLWDSFRQSRFDRRIQYYASLSGSPAARARLRMLDREHAIRVKRAANSPARQAVAARPGMRPSAALASNSAARNLAAELTSHNVNGEIVDASVGPVLIVFRVKLAPGSKISKLQACLQDVASALGVPSIVAYDIPGSPFLGLQLPRDKRDTVGLKTVLDSPQFRTFRGALPIAVGVGVDGSPVVADLGAMPHLLIAGATGAGKSVELNAILMSLVLRLTPSQLRLILIDPKCVELALYDSIPHLAAPVVSDGADAAAYLEWVVAEMERRYSLLEARGVRDIGGYNARASSPLPYIVVVVDEVADLMATSRQIVEKPIQRLGQKARAAGIHLILATQRPSVDVVTGVIKANFPARIGLRTSSAMDSRTILDADDANKLLGKGDLFYRPADRSELVRVHGCYVSDEEVRAVCGRLKGQGMAGNYLITSLPSPERSDPLYERAVQIAREGNGILSYSTLAAKLSIGVPRAKEIHDQLIAAGFVAGRRYNKGVRNSER